MCVRKPFHNLGDSYRNCLSGKSYFKDEFKWVWLLFKLMQPELSRSKQTFGLWPWIKEEKVLVLLCNARRNLNLALKPAEFFLAVRELEGLWEKLFTTDLKVYFSSWIMLYNRLYTRNIWVYRTETVRVEITDSSSYRRLLPMFGILAWKFA